MDRWRDGQEVENDEDDAQQHAAEQDAESRRSLNYLDDTKLVAALDVPK